MAVTYTFTLSGNKVIVDEAGGTGGARKFTYRADYNVMPSKKAGHVIITDNANDAGLSNNTYEYDISTILVIPGAPLAHSVANVNTTVAWLTTNFFKGLTIADLTVDEVNVDLDAGTADERVSTIVYSSATALADSPSIPSVTETFVWAGSSGAYRVSTITLS
jgi:hypothetical protein